MLKPDSTWLPNGPGTAIPPQKRKEPTMTADAFRTMSTCVAAMFVSMMLVTAATSVPLIG
jgi:hypothetical protein